MQLAHTLFGPIMGQRQVNTFLQLALQVLHLLLQLARQSNLVGLRIHVDIQIDGVQAVHSEVTARLSVLVFKRRQVVQIHRFAIYDANGHLLQRLRILIRSQQQVYSFLVVNHLTHDILAPHEIADTLLYVIGRQAIVSQNHRIIGYLDILADAPRHLHALHILQPFQFGFHLSFNIFFQLFVAQV